jgi:protein tyrosine phosphatase (PTP) superfamily phosphohydrolase (DUF442 family)/GNAT superfamily N-acetyltransferase
MSEGKIMPWPLRLARTGDVPALEALIPLSVRALQAPYYSSTQMDAAIGPVFGVDNQLITDGTYFVVEAGGRIIACGGWSKRKAVCGGDRGRTGEDELIDPARDAARIRAFFVHPDFARRGIGRAILLACDQAILANGFDRAELVATLAGEPLYAASGYEVVERYDYPMSGGLTLPVVRMGKRLKPEQTQGDEQLQGIRSFIRLSPRLATSGQPTEEQFAAIAAGGFESVINLALPTSTHALPNEHELVAAHGLEYIHIPVVWESPQYEDFARFATALAERKGRRVFVHCALNMRVSAFMFLHRTLVEGTKPEDALEDLHRIWEPDETWRSFIAEVSARWGNSPTPS